MVKNQSNPCGQCKRTCSSNSVLCENCNFWFHAKCEKLSSKDINVLISAKSGYLCSTCSGNDYHSSLMRISEAACRGYSYMAKYVLRESVVMRKPFCVTEEMDMEDVYQGTIDWGARQLQLQYDVLPDMKPMWVYSDGSCLFNAVSVALCGKQDMAEELRVRTVIEMVVNAEKYKTLPKAKDYMSLAPHYKDACVDCGKAKGWSSVRTMLAVATVIGRAIVSVYPPCNGVDDFPYQTLNTTILPVNTSHFNAPRSEPIYIMWTGGRREKGWTPNHYVPLISKPKSNATFNVQPAKMETAGRDFSSNSSTYEQDFPDLSSSLEDCSAHKRQKTSGSPLPQMRSTPVISTSASTVQTKNTPEKRINSPPQKNSTPINSDDTVPLDEQFSNASIDSKSISAILNTMEKGKEEKSYETKEDSQNPENYNSLVSDPNEDNDARAPDECSDLTIQQHVPEGGFASNGRGLSAKEIYSLITQNNTVLPRVPNGIKSNCYFLIDNGDNIKRLEKNENASYCDDCGAWNSDQTRTVELTYVLKNGTLQFVKKKDGKYCIKKVKSGVVNWIPLEPQPDTDDVVILHKYYSTLKRSPEFSKHISWFKKLPGSFQNKSSAAVVEYFGLYPVRSLSVHGQSKTANRQYVKTYPETKNAIKRKLKENIPVRTIFKDLCQKNPETAPRDYRVIENLKRQEKKQNSQTLQGDTLADEMLQVFKLLRTHPFVQEVNSTKSHAPTVILYTEEQIKDFQFFLSKKTDYVVGVDRTFNLGATYVTCFTYKNLRFLRNKTKDHPVFFGPMYLHWDGSFESYHYFFSHIRARLTNPIAETELQVGNSFNIGSDDEKALTKALDVCFQNSERYLCTKHMKDNLSHFLTQKEEMDEKRRKRIVYEIFGPGGLVDANDSFVFEQQSSKLKTENQRYQHFLKYFESALKPRIFKHVNKHRRQTEQNEPLWTNNACESLNAVLKKDIDWKPQKTPELIGTLYDAVNLQMLDLRASMHGSGNYHLAPGYGHYLVPSVVWGSKSNADKQKLFTDFLFDRKRRLNPKTLKARNVSFEIPNEQKLAKKAGQKRKRTKTSKRYF